MSPRTATTIRLDDDLKAALAVVKDRDGIPISEQLRRAILLWLETKGVTIEKPAPRRVQPRRKASPRQ